MFAFHGNQNTLRKPGFRNYLLLLSLEYRYRNADMGSGGQAENPRLLLQRPSPHTRDLFHLFSTTLMVDIYRVYEVRAEDGVGWLRCHYEHGANMKTHECFLIIP